MGEVVSFGIVMGGICVLYLPQATPTIDENSMKKGFPHVTQFWESWPGSDLERTCHPQILTPSRPGRSPEGSRLPNRRARP